MTALPTVALCNRVRLGFTCTETAAPHVRHQAVEAERRAVWTDREIGVQVLPLADTAVLPNVGGGPDRGPDPLLRRMVTDHTGREVARDEWMERAS